MFPLKLQKRIRRYFGSPPIHKQPKNSAGVLLIRNNALSCWTEPEDFPFLNMPARETDPEPPIQWCDFGGSTDSSALLHSRYCSVNARPENYCCDQPQIKTHKVLVLSC